MVKSLSRPDFHLPSLIFFAIFPYLCSLSQTLLRAARHIIVGIIDFFHRPVARWIPTTTFRYLACGGTNTVLSIVMEYVSINYILHRQPTQIYGGFQIAPEVGAWMIAFAISFPAGFVLSRHIVFPESNLHGRVQLFRYALMTVTFLLLTYILIKLFAFALPGLNPTVSYTFICVFTAVLSYISQRKFTFKITPQEISEEVVTD
jgi:putative flippase GtrA